MPPTGFPSLMTIVGAPRVVVSVPLSPSSLSTTRRATAITTATTPASARAIFEFIATPSLGARAKPRRDAPRPDGRGLLGPAGEWRWWALGVPEGDQKPAG